MRGTWVASLIVVATACAAKTAPPRPLPVPKAVPFSSDVRTFRGPELEQMRANYRLAGIAYGTGCYCMPSYVVHGDEPEGTNLRGHKCADASISPEDSPTCFGLDPHGIEQEGRYLCRAWTLGPALPSNNSSAGTLE